MIIKQITPANSITQGPMNFPKKIFSSYTIYEENSLCLLQCILEMQIFSIRNNEL
ncbi:hypothetical protein NMY3_00351 [Candidatus Nitrosocosmicus oleophilus]|uniref:Uncharacterized protein n=1 Tax=Candidatus Nitrosocosmicus oleophilus TaxID=1353260 RepID=A0A654LTJ4_9ARCH|nr:hypothetical protein NMY3_00351 [Candidatus Nitrosocosmicus oleophilus]